MLKIINASIIISFFLTATLTSAETIKNVDYAGTGKLEHTLNLYLPEGDGPFPVVLHYPGLAYTWSDAKTDGGLANSYNNAGFAVVGGNVSGGGDGSHMAHYPAQIQELKATVRFLRANAEKYRLDPTFIGIIGFSSGAWNSTILATTGDVDKITIGSETMNLEGEFGGNLEFSSRVQAAWAAASPTDFLAMDGCGSILNHETGPEAGLIGGNLSQNKDKCALANPITFISRDDPPIHLVHGTSDNIVPTCQSELMWEVLKNSSNVKDNAYEAVGGGHQSNFNGSLDFFRNALKNNKSGCLDTTSETFDPEATFWCGIDCCNITARRSINSAVIKHSIVTVNKLNIINNGTEKLSFTVFDLAGHAITSGQLVSHGTFNLEKTGKGLRLIEIIRKNSLEIQCQVLCP